MRPTSFPTDELTLRRKNAVLSRQNSRQSVKSLIESIESQAKPGSKSCKNSLIAARVLILDHMLFSSDDDKPK